MFLYIYTSQYKNSLKKKQWPISDHYRNFQDNFASTYFILTAHDFNRYLFGYAAEFLAS